MAAAVAAACNENGPMIGPALARGGSRVRPIDDGHDGHNAKRILAALLLMCILPILWRCVNPSSRRTPFSGLALHYWTCCTFIESVSTVK